MKKFYSFLIALLHFTALCTAGPITVNGIVYNIDQTTNTACVSRNYEASGDIILLSEVQYGGNTYPVTSIDNYAFYGLTEINSVVVPEGVTSLGKSCFNRCESLKSISFPSTLQSIGEWSFYRCYSLESITIPEGVTQIGENAFHDCWTLKTVSLPSTLTKLDEAIFNVCKSLKSIVIPEGVVTMEYAAFAQCDSLESVYLPEGLTNLGHTCFAGCPALKSIDIPSTVTSIGIGCFAAADSLASIVIPEGVKSLGDFCFLDCTSLKTVQIPSTMETIGAESFTFCPNLESITCHAEVPPMLGDSVWTANSFAEYEAMVGESIENKIITPIRKDLWALFSQHEVWLYVPEEAVDTYKATDQWKEFRFPENPGTGIDGVDARNVASVKYHTANGMATDQPQAGFNIVVTHYTDGSRTATKVMR